MPFGVRTTYYLNSNPYASYILGDDLSRIKVAAQLRGLGEIIESVIIEIDTLPDYSKLSNEEFITRLPEIAHTATFLSFVALNARTVSLLGILGDEGILHEISHLLADVEGCQKKSLTCVRDLLKNLQKMAIGFYEPV